MTERKLPWALQYEVWRHQMAPLPASSYPTLDQYRKIFDLLTEGAPRSESGQISNKIAANFAKTRSSVLRPHTNVTTPEEVKKIVAEVEKKKMRDPLEELDREELDIESGKMDRLGVSEVQDQTSSWFGGQGQDQVFPPAG